MTTVIETIEELLERSSDTPLAAIEDTLTTGYASALELERERLRIERHLRDLIRNQGRRRDIVAASEELDATEERLSSLRLLLARLRKHVYDPRVAAELPLRA
jgi:hypothetical protein